MIRLPSALRAVHGQPWCLPSAIDRALASDRAGLRALNASEGFDSAPKAAKVRAGDAERAAGLPVSSLSDRHGVDVGDSQAAFIEYVVRPAYLALQPLAPKTVSTALRLIDENKVRSSEMQ